MAVKFCLDSRPNKQGEYPIRACFSIKCQKYTTSIGISVSKSVWGDGHVKSKVYTNGKGLTGPLINTIIKRIENHFMVYEINLVDKPTTGELKEQLNMALKNQDEEDTPEVGNKKSANNDSKAVVEKRKTVFDDLNEFMRDERIARQWALATYKCMITFRNHLKKFNKNIKYEDFNEEGLNKFVNFLRVKQKLEERSARKQFKNLKWFLNWSIRKGYCKEDYINRYTPKFKVVAKPVIFLTKEELLKLYNYDIPSNRTKVILRDINGRRYEKVVQESNALAKTRDLFCFCAFTSLRYSDMANVKRTDIIGDTLYVTTQKTNDRLPIDLNSFALEILDKYEDKEFPNGLALPVLTNQKMNKYLKDLCELCEFRTPVTTVYYRAGQRLEETVPKWSLVGTHAGRRTFICFALSSGIPPQVVMKWTGHSDYKSMKPYIDIAEKTKAEAMSIFDKSLRE